MGGSGVFGSYAFLLVLLGCGRSTGETDVASTATADAAVDADIGGDVEGTVDTAAPGDVADSENAEIDALQGTEIDAPLTMPADVSEVDAGQLEIAPFGCDDNPFSLIFSPETPLPDDPTPWATIGKFNDNPAVYAALGISACVKTSKCEGATLYKCYDNAGKLVETYWPNRSYAETIPCSPDQMEQWLHADAALCFATVPSAKLPPGILAILEPANLPMMVCTNGSSTRFQIELKTGAIYTVNRSACDYDVWYLHAPQSDLSGLRKDLGYLACAWYLGGQYKDWSMAVAWQCSQVNVVMDSHKSPGKGLLEWQEHLAKAASQFSTCGYNYLYK